LHRGDEPTLLRGVRVDGIVFAHDICPYRLTYSRIGSYRR
jgi:hypothetical protein